MSYWWVNQRSSYKESLAQGILWAPLIDARQSPRADWRRLEDLHEGDIVYHYSRKSLRAVSVVQNTAHYWRTPEGFPDRDPKTIGLCVRTEYQELNKPVPLKRLREGHSSALLSRGPFDKNGAVHRGYIFSVDDILNSIIVNLIDAHKPTEELSEDLAASNPGGKLPGLKDTHPFLDTDHRMTSDGKYVGTLDRHGISSSRGEQSDLRKYLLGTTKIAQCALCGRTLPQEFIHIGHIKRRSDCTDDERRDFRSVAMPVCLLGCDTLFEEGYVAVRDDGVIVGIESKNLGIREAIGLVSGKICRAHNSYSSKYFKYHYLRSRAGRTDTNGCVQNDANLQDGEI